MSILYVDTISPNSGNTVSVSGSLFVSGNIILGDEGTDSLSFGADVSSSILPNASFTYDLGSNSRQWRFIYGGTGSFDHLSGAPIIGGNLTVNGNITGATGSFGSGNVSLESNVSKFYAISASTYISASKFNSTNVNSTNAVITKSSFQTGAFGLNAASNTTNPSGTPLFVGGHISASGRLTVNSVTSSLLAIEGLTQANIYLSGSSLITAGYINNKKILYLGNANQDVVSFSGTSFIFYGSITSSGHLIPSSSDTHDLGSSTKYWRDLYVSSGSLKFVSQSGLITSLSQANVKDLTEGRGIATQEGIEKTLRSRALFHDVDTSSYKKMTIPGRVSQFISGTLVKDYNFSGSNAFVSYSGLQNVEYTNVTTMSINITGSGGTFIVSGGSTLFQNSITSSGNISASGTASAAGFGINTGTSNVTAGTISGSGFNISDTISSNTGSFNGGIVVNGGDSIAGGISVVGNISSSGAITAGALTTSGAVDLNATTLDIDASAAATIDAVGIALNAGSGELDLTTTGTMDVNANALDMDLTDSSDITLTSSEAAEDLTISQVGANDSSIIITAAGTGADAIKLDATAGSMLIAPSLTDGKTLRIGKNGATEMIFAPHGTAANEKITITNVAGTEDDALELSAGLGAITLESLQTIITSNHPKLTIKSDIADGDGSLIFKSGDGSTMATIRCDVTNNVMNQLSIGSGTNETHLVLDANGKIGIGLNTPGEQLTVAGNISASGAVYASGILDTNVVEQSGTAAEDLTAVAKNTVWYANTAQAGAITLPQATATNAGMVIKIIVGTTDWSGTAFKLGFANGGSTVLTGYIRLGSNAGSEAVDGFVVTANAKSLEIDADDATAAGGAIGSTYTFTYLEANLVHVEANGQVTTGTPALDAGASTTTGTS